MDWSNEDYVRVYTRETADDLDLSWQALALWRTLITKFDRSGIIPLRKGWESVARLIRWPVEVVASAGPELVADGRVRLVEQGLFAPNFTAAQTASKSDRLRQRDLRDKRREAAMASNDVSATTECHATSRDVASESRPVAEESRDVTQNHSTLAVADSPVATQHSNTNTYTRVRAEGTGAVARAVWQYGATQYTAAKASGIDPAAPASAWPAMPDASSSGWTYLLDRCEAMLASSSHAEAIATGKRRIDVAIATARSTGSLQYCVPIFAFEAKSWEIGCSRSPEQVDARAGPRPSSTASVGRVEPSKNYPEGDQKL